MKYVLMMENSYILRHNRFPLNLSDKENSMFVTITPVKQISSIVYNIQFTLFIRYNWAFRHDLLICISDFKNGRIINFFQIPWTFCHQLVGCLEKKTNLYTLQKLCFLVTINIFFTVASVV